MEKGAEGGVRCAHSPAVRSSQINGPPSIRVETYNESGSEESTALYAHI